MKQGLPALTLLADKAIVCSVMVPISRAQKEKYFHRHGTNNIPIVTILLLPDLAGARPRNLKAAQL